MSASASGALVTRRFAGSQSIRVSRRLATFPSRQISVSGPEYSKSAPAFRPALQARTQSCSCEPSTRGIDFRACRLLHQAFGDDARAVAVNAAHDLALGAFENKPPFGGHLAAVLQLRRPRRTRPFVPGELDGRHGAAGREAVGDDGREGMGFGVEAAGGGLHGCRRVELQRPDRRVERVGPAVAHHAAAEIPPATPDHRVIGRMIRAERRRADPQVPVEPGRDGGVSVGRSPHLELQPAWPQG